MVIQDIVIHTSEHVAPTDVLVGLQAPPDERFQIADDLWIDPLSDDLAKQVFDSCEPPGRFVHKPPRPFQQLYAFVREHAPPDPAYEWDSDKRLLNCVALSRLVHPTTISFRYAARIVYSSNGELHEIVPGPVSGHGAEVSRVDEASRDWLITAEFEALGDLVQLYSAAHLPPRISRAFWYHEYAARTFYADVRCTLVCTALEALVHTDRLGSTQQFSVRVSRLAAELGIDLSRDDAEVGYDMRSALSHGQGLPEFTGEDRRLYGIMEITLQRGLVRAIRDRDFAEVFLTPERIRDRWPLE